MRVDGVDLPQVDELLQGLVDEDEADEGGEGLLGEARDVADQRAGVRGNQQEAEQRGPQADARPQGQVGEAVVPDEGVEEVVEVVVEVVEEVMEEVKEEVKEEVVEEVKEEVME